MIGKRTVKPTLPRPAPHIFASATLVLLKKIDLLPYVEFDVDRFEHDVRLVNPRADILQISATRGDGLPQWHAWLQRCVADSTPRPT